MVPCYTFYSIWLFFKIGNPLNWRGGMSFTWQNGRQLAGISKDGLTASYAYNDSGIRLRKTVNGVATQYYLNGSMIVAEVTGDVQTDYYYDESGNVFGFKRGDSEYYYIHNGQGDIIGILDSSGTQIVSYVYDSWGKLVSISGSQAETIGEANPFRYRGYYYDTETGLYYLNSRYYDPEVGRFLNADGEIANIGGEVSGYNLFSYCFNNPVNMSDFISQWPNWGKLFSGASLMATGIIALAAVATVITGGAATPLLVTACAVTATAGSAAVVMGTAEIQESFTGVNPVKETVFQGDDKKYQQARNIVETTASVSTVVTGTTAIGTKIAQETGKMATKVPISKVLNNPLDEFVTSGPAPGVIGDYCRSIPINGYGKIYATQLPNGFYQLANGHHRVAALKSLGKDTIKIFIVK